MNRIAELFRGRAQQTALPHLHNNLPNFTLPSIKLSARAIQLDIYVGRRCPICQAAQSTVQQLQNDLPNVKINVIDLDVPNTPRPDIIIAIPSFVINGHLVAAGNPDWDQLKRFINSLN